MIKEEARKEKREIFYWDECWFMSNNHFWKTRWQKGKTVIVKSNWARFWVSAVSVISNYWWMKFMVYKWNFNADLLIVFLKRMIHNTNRKFTIILDWHPTHKTKKVDAFLESINYQIRLYILPWYSPELNPDENIRAWSKNDTKGQIFADKESLASWVRKSLYKLQKDISKVSSFFFNDRVWFFSK
jgi:transposase